ncbi:MAG: homoserine dehydrogenase [Candidatus Krumholzibacteria bacterium]|nr:homoserine dehydrogenase [Candidatus Krumholzibacteria bacterium]
MQKIAIIGFGNVGQGLARILIDKKTELKRKQGFEYRVVAISDFRLGSVYDAQGIDLKRAMNAVEKKGSLDAYRGGTHGWDAMKTIEKCKADTLVELAYTDLETGKPAIDHVRAALKRGMNVVTSNKGPAALAYPSLSRLAKKNGCQLLIEGTVMSGTPVLNLAMNDLAGNDFHSIRGILNGTTNYMLSEMEEGASYDAVLDKAQKLGYAEADPTGDVEGIDAAGKVTILANMFMGAKLKPSDVRRRGITRLTPGDIENAKKTGRRWKLIGEVKRKKNGEVDASVRPVMLLLADPLASVMGPTNAITFDTDLLGKVTVVGPGAGRVETGYSILTDLLAIERSC